MSLLQVVQVIDLLERTFCYRCGDGVAATGGVGRGDVNQIEVDDRLVGVLSSILAHIPGYKLLILIRVCQLGKSCNSSSLIICDSCIKLVLFCGQQVLI